MFPFLLPLWEADLTARAAVEQGIAASVTDIGTGALLTGAEGSLAGLARAPRAEYGFSLGGSYARAAYFTLGAAPSIPNDSASAALDGRAAWQTSPRTSLSWNTGGYLATRLGVRADDALAQRDPFLYGQRLQYTIATGPGFSVTTSRRSFLDMAASYEQTGAVSGEDPRAVGVDTHEALARLRYSYELSDVDAVGPEFEYNYTHYYNALLDIYLNRGSADVHAGTALFLWTHAFGSRTVTRIGAGVTVASPPPIVGSTAAVVAPAARAGLTYATGRYDFMLDYAYEYTSLGARIGYGQEHNAIAQLSFLPLKGGKFRDVVMTGVARAAIGSAPIAANPPVLPDPDLVPPSLEGTLTTITAAAGARMDVPLLVGLQMYGAFDLEFVRATFDPPSVLGQTNGGLRTIWTIGISGTISTDRRQMVPQEPAGDPRLDTGASAARTALTRFDSAATQTDLVGIENQMTPALIAPGDTRQPTKAEEESRSTTENDKRSTTENDKRSTTENDKRSATEKERQNKGTTRTPSAPGNGARTAPGNSSAPPVGGSSPPADGSKPPATDNGTPPPDPSNPPPADKDGSPSPRNGAPSRPDSGKSPTAPTESPPPGSAPGNIAPPLPR
ncbi:hypothetical protein [Chondromyces apiculatus]|uniref:Uncharacterized protein n=1 Tax=Chondromyces apiculatus DSM 436 TaxID=1192034 RepID=A0A017SZP4_9BACT|nr:hypothetical protein [Chondromyces apiculatus]EYF02443.1 Hypothetical protein CAP_7065 [Chondromyces apiculatus DSM 436]